MNRAAWQQLAEDRILDAMALLAAQRWSAAYYLAGYAVECGLKACVVGRVAATPEVVFEERKFSEQCWTHDLDELVRLAGLDTLRATDIAANANRGTNWGIVRRWNEQNRYRQNGQAVALELYDAITNPTNGVMIWLKLYW